jgi:ketosteroid isomerase-like protein
MKEPLKQYIDATNTQDFDEVEKYVHQDAVYIFSGQEVKGIKDVRAYFEKTWSKIKDETYWATDVQWIHEDDQTMICLYQYHYNGYFDGKFIEGSGRATNVFIKCAVTNEWKLHHEHLSK